MKRITIFLACYILWLLLTWPYSADRGWDRQILILGIGAAFLVSLLFKEISSDGTVCKVYSPKRWLWFLAYVPVFVYYCVKANLDVLYRILHPEMPINPGIVKVKTHLRSPSALTALANSITLTPGTMTVDITEDGYLYIHWINVQTIDSEKATEIIVRRFEKFIWRIFE